jgi:hypothetical protein
MRFAVTIGARAEKYFAIGLDRELVHQSTRADDAHSHPRRRLVAAGEHVSELRDPGPGIVDADDEALRTGLGVHVETH